MMDELCPLCLKMGVNKKIKAVQINLEEALWMCEDEKCTWPFFGADELAFMTRRVGEKWGYEWQTYRRVREQVGSIPISTELSLYTPPVTPSSDASSKDCVQSDMVKNSSDPSNDNTNIHFSSSSSTRDSYAPTCVADVDSLSQQKSDTPKVPESAKSVTSNYERDSKYVAKMPPISLPSIFDIDGDEVLNNKIGIVLHPDSQSCPAISGSIRHEKAVHNFENPSASIDRACAPVTTLLIDRACAPVTTLPIDRACAPVTTLPIDRACAPVTTLPIDRACATVTTLSSPMKNAVESPKVEKTVKIVNENVKNDSKSLPQIRSIDRTNIDLQIIDSSDIAKSQKTDSSKQSSTFTNLKSPEKNVVSSPSSKHTTTIKVDGIPPITLSYNLGDLDDCNDKNLPMMTTSTPISREKRVLPNVDHVDESSTEKIPKKPRQEVKRRFCNTGKAFQKFSFSDLKKVTEKSSIVTSTPESQKIKELHDDRCNVDVIDSNSSGKNVVASETASTIIHDKTVNLGPNRETLNSLNSSAACNSIVNETPAIDTLNLNCLIDDILLDGYQNATQNLNDDWLDSFFNDKT